VQEGKWVTRDMEIEQEIDAEPSWNDGDPKPLPLPAFV
jgi:hypothetical protein